MTLQELQTSDKITLTPAEVCEVLGCKPYSINVQAQEDPRKLGFPVAVIGTRVRIPRVGFLKWLEGIGLFDDRDGSCSIQGENYR